ncbi:MAG: glutamine--fructose-6-phosphate transaminase (isomerizing) [Candidatus Hydrogenedentes bacterium]|nr:glutamine--fructose-6-phosphate transaminase (isomerizing) [Candidatus Hydrogenedentota bacterium]
MCGIVGYIGTRDAVEIILSGLHRLEYRGYDSAGIAVVTSNGLDCVKAPGKLSGLEEALRRHPLHANLGIGHTRWATHGAPSETNAHPHLDAPMEIAVVHNGIIENYHELRAQLQADGVEFRSQTDTEVIPHLVRRYYEGNLFAAVRRALSKLEGAYAIGVVCSAEPNLLVAARQGSPLIIGVGQDEMFIASDVPAILKYTRRVAYLENGQVCALHRDGFWVEDIDGVEQRLPIETVDLDETAAEKENFPHFMLKEIYQQPEVIRNTLRGRAREGSHEVRLDDMHLAAGDLLNCSKIVMVSCGTSWHASLAGKYIIESLARVPVEVDLASEFRYRNPILRPDTIVMAVTQSGETADTLEAIRIAKKSGARVVSIVNVVGSSIARESHGVLYTQAGPEIGVASTKAYTSQVTALSLFAIYLANLRETATADTLGGVIEHLRAIPEKLQWCLDHQDTVRKVSGDPRYCHARSFLYLGRSYNLPSALEGALKLKEISYIHAEGYGAGEMKHGPIALVTGAMPVVCIAVRSAVYDKMLSNIQEIRAREGLVLAIATEGDEAIRRYCDDVIYVPECYEPLSPIVVAIPVQLLAYYIAVNRHCDVDQPRNLAKSVTVE